MDHTEKHAYIPAYPGFHTVALNSLNKICKTPVIAWDLVEESFNTPHAEGIILVVFPVTTEGADSKSAILYPDGQVNAVHGDFPSVAEWYESELRDIRSKNNVP
jgi:hypothetical protein